MLTAMVGMGALAVDLGAAYTERRHDQNTADAAVMSGAVESVLGGGIIDDVVAEVGAKVDTTLGREVTDAEWTACTDPDQLAYTTTELQAGNPTIDPVTDCISFSAGFDRIRVKLPDQEAISVFGSALGFGTIETTASAEAEIVPGPGAGAPPFIAFEGTTKGDFVCLRTSSAGDPELYLMQGNGPGVAPTVSGSSVDPCHSSQNGVFSSTFGTINPWAYEAGCQRGNDQIQIAISVGIDHLLGVFAGGYDTVAQDLDGDGVFEIPGDPAPGAVAGDGFDSRTRVDGAANCTTAFPNTLTADTGLTAQMLRCALLSEKNGPNQDLCLNEYPRLQQGTSVQTDLLVVGEKLDNVAPWTYLNPASTLHAGNVPDACVILAASRQSDTFDLGSHPRYNTYVTTFTQWNDPTKWDQYDRYDLFISCLKDWTVGVSSELFTEDIGTAARFAFIPQVAETTISAAQEEMHIEGFLPVYLYRLYVKAQGGGSHAMCDPLDPRTTDKYYVHDAGQTNSRFTQGGKKICGDSNDNLSRLSAIALACGMVPDSLCDKDTSLPKSAGRDIYEFRLVE